MPKEYRCNKLVGLNLCNEEDPAKFDVGRYTTCKSCRNRMNTEYHKSKKNEEKAEKHNIIDPDFNIRVLIEETIKSVKFYKNTRTLLDKVEDLEEMASDSMVYNSDKFEGFDDKICKLEAHIKRLENEIIDLKSKTKL